jgi:hypothetical protein
MLCNIRSVPVVSPYPISMTETDNLGIPASVVQTRLSKKGDAVMLAWKVLLLIGFLVLPVLMGLLLGFSIPEDDEWEPWHAC